MTELGKDAVIDTRIKTDPGYTNTRTSNITYYDSVRVHDFKVIASIDGSIPPVDRWFETWAEHEELHFEKVDGGYVTFLKGFKARFTSESLIIFLGTFRGEDVRKVKNRAMSFASEAFEYVKTVSPVKFESNELTPDFRVSQQEIALAPSVFGEFLKDETPVDINEVYVDAEDGRRRIHLDESGEVEIEFTHPELAEEDARFWKEEFLKDVADNKDSWRSLFSREKDGYFDELKEIIGIQSLLSLQNTLRETGQQGKRRPVNDIGLYQPYRPRPQDGRIERGSSSEGNRYTSERGLSREKWLKLEYLELKMYKRLDRYKRM